MISKAANRMKVAVIVVGKTGTMVVPLRALGKSAVRNVTFLATVLGLEK